VALQLILRAENLSRHLIGISATADAHSHSADSTSTIAQCVLPARLPDARPHTELAALLARSELAALLARSARTSRILVLRYEVGVLR
jgi:hypothetical protein